MNEHRVAIQKSSEAFGLGEEDMLATCAYALMTPKGGLVNVLGDGVTAEIYSSGIVSLTSYQWANNAPLYPAYAVDNYKSFIEYHGNDLKAPLMQVEHCLLGLPNYDNNLLPTSTFTSHRSLETCIQGAAAKKPAGVLKFIAVFTDGVLQVDGMKWQDVVLELLAFKNLEGEFAKRRMIRFIKDSKKDAKKGPLDDISFAVIRIDEGLNRESNG